MRWEGRGGAGFPVVGKVFLGPWGVVDRGSANPETDCSGLNIWAGAGKAGVWPLRPGEGVE
jgi:hypothetical protein